MGKSIIKSSRVNLEISEKAKLTFLLTCCKVKSLQLQECKNAPIHYKQLTELVVAHGIECPKNCPNTFVYLDHQQGRNSLQ